MALSSWDGWAFIPGPLRAADVPDSTIVLQDITDYSPRRVARVLLESGFRLCHGAEPSWWEWTARWGRKDRFVAVNMTLFETEPVLWGGSEIKDARCEAADLLAIWLKVRKKCRGIWLQHHDKMFTPALFKQESGLVRPKG